MIHRAIFSIDSVSFGHWTVVAVIGSFSCRSRGLGGDCSDTHLSPNYFLLTGKLIKSNPLSKLKPLPKTFWSACAIPITNVLPLNILIYAKDKSDWNRGRIMFSDRDLIFSWRFFFLAFFSSEKCLSHSECFFLCIMRQTWTDRQGFPEGNRAPKGLALFMPQNSTGNNYTLCCYM